MNRVFGGSMEAKASGYFSRRHKTSAGLERYRVQKEADLAYSANVIVENQAARAARSPQQQINRLDKMFGKGIGAVKERKRLMAKIPKEKKKEEVSSK